MLDDSLGIPFLSAIQCWMIPCLETEKFPGFNKFTFHVFDRYGIHIQAFVDFINGKLSSSDPHLRKIEFKNDILKMKPLFCQ